ncbi:MAG: type II CRISPR-associated endonuclease Cas1 [Cyclobacteriaceae bacterium]|nr:type II CRISPR-associated endonuclease Cas1 [Cyclobacteriaceae bacterium]
MIKRTLYFGNPGYLSRKDDQLVLRLPEVEKNETLPESFKKGVHAIIPIEDIGVVILDHTRLTITQYLIDGLIENNVALISCDKTHHPTGLMLNLSGNKLQSAKFKEQLNASQPLVKQLWQQTIKAKISNQAFLLQRFGYEATNMTKWVGDVKSGDPDNLEARAAAYYWKNIFPQIKGFKREREGIPPNNLLNYTYAILRAIIARSLVGSGLLPTLGIHHRNQYNHYCLADDIMEPYRPFADAVVCEIIKNGEDYHDLNPSIKKQLLGIATMDVRINGERSPLMVAAQRTTASLAKCFDGTEKKVLYPELPT